LLDVIKGIAQSNKAFARALFNVADEARPDTLFMMMDMGMPSGKKLGFLDAHQLARLREITLTLSYDATDLFIAALKQTGKALDSKALAQEFQLDNAGWQQVTEAARRFLLADPALVADKRRLTQRVREHLKGGRTAGEFLLADKVPGGLADKKKPSDFDPKALAKGQKVEMEHTDDPALAREIAMDHLTEDPSYYDKLEVIEKKAKTFELNVGDPVLMGKYKNSPGRIEGFGETDKGDPTMVVRKKPKKDEGQGAKKETQIFKVRYDEEQAKRDKEAIERVARRFVQSCTRTAGRAAPGSKGQKSIRQGRFVVWYLPRYEDMVPVVLGGLKQAEAAYSRAKYGLPNNIPVLMAARPFGSQRSIYSPANGGFIQLVPSAFDTKAEFATFVHELAHYVHAHQIPGGFRNPFVTMQFSAAGAAEARTPSAPTEDPLEKAKETLAQVEKMWVKAAGLLRKGQRFTVNYEDYFSKKKSQREVEIIKRTSRGRKSDFVMKWLEPTPEELANRHLGITKSLVPLVRMMVNPAQVSPKLGPGVEALLEWEQEAFKAYNEAVIAQSQTPEAKYEKHKAKWFPTSYSQTNPLEWFAELVTARVLAPSSMDSEVAGWIDALMRTGKAPKTAAGKFKDKKTIKNQKGEEQVVYEYSERQIANRHREKAEKVEKLRGSLHKLQSAITKDLKSKDEKTRLCALAVGLMNDTYERVGNEGSAKEGHFGVTGWQAKHVSFSGGSATFSYVGKSGVKQTKTTSDAGLVAGLKAALKGKSGTDPVFEGVEASDVNEYLKPHGITAKDIRGLHANREVQTRLKAIRGKGGELPSDPKKKKEKLKKEFDQALNEAAAEVGHEAATLRSQYLVPGIEDNFLRDGTVKEKLNKQGKTAIIHIDHATDGHPDDGRLRGLPGLMSSLTLFEQAVMQDMLVHDVDLMFDEDDGSWLLRNHEVPDDVVQELTAAGYLAEEGGRIGISPLFKAKQRLYTAGRRAVGLKVFLDDERKTPAGWTRVYWPEEAIRLLKTNRVTEISLDHDLGDDNHGTGYDVVLWIEEAVATKGFKPPIMRVHSANSSAARKMEQDITQIHKLYERFNKSARRLAARWFVEATKSPVEKEDEEVERLVRRNPKKKPPRRDLRRNRVEDDDPDTEKPGADNDRDLSKNYKKVAARVAERWVRHLMAKGKGEHKPGDVWQADSGVWVGAAPKPDAGGNMITHTFGKDDKGKEQAEAFAKGEAEKGEATDKAEEQQKKNERRKQLQQERKQTRDEIKEALASLDLPTEVSKALEAQLDGPEILRAYRDEMKAVRADLEEHGISTEMMRNVSKDPFKDLDTSDAEAVAAAVVQAKVRDALLLDPSNVGGKPLSSTPLDSKARAGRAEEAMKQFRRVSPEQRKEVAEKAAQQLAALDPESPEASELNAIIDGLHAAFVLNDEPFEVSVSGGERNTRDEDELAELKEELKGAKDEKKKEELESEIKALEKRVKRKEKATSQGGLLREPLSDKLKLLLKHMVRKGDAKVLFMENPSDAYQAKGRAAVRDAMGEMDDDSLIALSADTPWSPIADVLGSGTLDPEVAEYLRSILRDMGTNSMTTVQGCAAALTRGKADAANDPEVYDEVAKQLQDAAAADIEAACESFLDECMGESLTEDSCKVGGEAIQRAQIEATVKAMDEMDPPPDPQDVPVAVARAVANGGELSLLDDTTIRRELTPEEEKREFLRHVKDPEERRRIEKMSPQEFAAMKNAILDDEDAAQVA